MATALVFDEFRRRSHQQHHQQRHVEIPPRAMHFIAAGTAAAFSSALYNPLDCLRVRWQVSTCKEQNILRFASKILKSEGLLEGLWRPGIGANATGMALSAAIRFGYYESVRDYIIDDDEEKSYKHMVLAGLLCGSAGYILTTPFHLVKTLIQAEKGMLNAQGLYVSGSRVGQEPYVTDFLSGVERLLREKGVTSLYKGALPLSSRGALFTAGQMMGYDGLKTMAKSRGYHDGVPLHVLCSISASFGASLLSAPADLVMAKYMSSSSNQTLMTCIQEIYVHNGIPGFWRGWGVFFIRLTPVMLTFSTVYEQLRNDLGLGYFD